MRRDIKVFAGAPRRGFSPALWRAVLTNRSTGRSVLVILACAWALFCLLLFWQGAASAAPLASSSAAQVDAQILQNAATTNYGGGTLISVDGDTPSGSGRDASALLKFDLSTIPAGSTIQSATLKLNVTNPSPNTYQAYALKRAWVESQATWNLRRIDRAWQISGAMGDNDREAAILASVTPSTIGTNRAFPLTSAGMAKVKAWVDNPSSNLGLVLANTTNADGLAFRSSETSTPPVLEVVYSEAVSSSAPRSERALDHMYTRYMPDAELDALLDKLADTGAETVQTAGPWDHLEPSAHDQYAWEFMDRFISHAEARGLKVRMQVSAVPDWVHPYLVDQGVPIADRVWTPPRGAQELALYEDFWFDLVSRYGTRVDSYEVWNEPNLDSFFEPQANVAEYAAMQRAAYVGAKRANPNVQIVCCALSQNDIGYMNQLYDALRTYPDAAANDDFFDHLGVHPYAYEGRNPLPPDAARSNHAGRWGPVDYTFVGIDKMKAVLDAHGDGHKRIWIGEFGYTTASGGYHYPVSDDLRAQYLRQAYPLLDQRPYVIGMSWFSYYRQAGWNIVDRATLSETHTFVAFRELAR